MKKIINILTIFTILIFSANADTIQQQRSIIHPNPKEIAKEHDIIIVENKPLARTLFKVAEVDREIPVEMFKAVADLLVLV